MNKIKKKWFLLKLLSLLLISCDNSADLNADKTSNQIKLQSLQKPKPIPKLESLDAFSYPEELNWSNPFEAKLPETKTMDHRLRVKPNLEHFALKSLKYVGILKNGTEVWALINRSDGVVSPVKKGDLLGEKGGKVIAIKETFLQLEEKILIAGTSKKEIKTMYLHPHKEIN